MAMYVAHVVALRHRVARLREELVQAELELGRAEAHDLFVGTKIVEDAFTYLVLE